MTGEDLTWRADGDRRTAEVASMVAAMDRHYAEAEVAHRARMTDLLAPLGVPTLDALLATPCGACALSTRVCIERDQTHLNAAMGTILADLGLPADRCCWGCDHTASHALDRQPATRTAGVDALAMIERRTTPPATAGGTTQQEQT